MNSDDVVVRAERTAAADEADGSRAGGAYRGASPAPSMYGAALLPIAAVAGAAAFGASAVSLALMGLGIPFLIAAGLAGIWAGLLVYSLGRWALARAARPLG